MKLEEDRLKRPLAYIRDALEEPTDFLAKKTKIETCVSSIRSQEKEGEKAKNHSFASCSRQLSKAMGDYGKRLKR
ncbi:unnamed protein product [Onchocerca flexuosa]|uniref:BAR domain-containing protein n=1 Tax=Onchocerca flexuosa TaxID=387005 RepID=A0A183GYR9_9BILA|nr:unnamed protein product [Onchocerca flexuosa]